MGVHAVALLKEVWPELYHAWRLLTVRSKAPGITLGVASTQFSGTSYLAPAHVDKGDLMFTAGFTLAKKDPHGDTKSAAMVITPYNVSSRYIEFPELCSADLPNAAAAHYPHRCSLPSSVAITRGRAHDHPISLQSEHKQRRPQSASEICRRRLAVYWCCHRVAEARVGVSKGRQDGMGRF